MALISKGISSASLKMSPGAAMASLRPREPNTKRGTTSIDAAAGNPRQFKWIAGLRVTPAELLRPSQDDHDAAGARGVEIIVSNHQKPPSVRRDVIIRRCQSRRAARAAHPMGVVTAPQFFRT